MPTFIWCLARDHVVEQYIPLIKLLRALSCDAHKRIRTLFATSGLNKMLGNFNGHAACLANSKDRRVRFAL